MNNKIEIRHIANAGVAILIGNELILVDALHSEYCEYEGISDETIKWIK